MLSTPAKSLLTVGEVLKRPLFAHARIAAGSRGLSRPIRWVHVLEAPENASFLKGGELVLSTGVGFSRETGKHLPYLEEVIRRRAAGLCIELGRYIPRIPPDMAELADHHGFPLIAFHQPVHFVDITMDLHEHLINLHNKALRQLENYSRDLQKLSLQTQSLPRILLHFQSLTHSQAFLYILDQPSFCGPNMPQTVQQEMTALIESRLLSLKALPRTPGLLPISPRKHLLYQPIVAMDNVLAYLCLVTYEEKGDEYLYLTLDYTAGAIAQILLRAMFVRERALSNESRLMEDILQGRADGGARRLQDILGPPLPGKASPYWAAILQLNRGGERGPAAGGEGDSPFHDFLAIFRAALRRRRLRSLMYSRGNRLYLLLGAAPAEGEMAGPGIGEEGRVQEREGKEKEKGKGKEGKGEIDKAGQKIGWSQRPLHGAGQEPQPGRLPGKGTGAANRARMGQEKKRVWEALQELETSCAKALEGQGAINFGIGRCDDADAAALRQAFTEAEQVLALGKRPLSPFFSDLGVYRLLLPHHDRESLASFFEDHLGPLLDHDRQHGTQLLPTLQAYLEQGLNKQETAAKLFIHRQTLYHRLDKITAVLGEDYLLPQNRLSLEIAFSIGEILL